MIDERRCTVLLRPERFSTNPPGAEHRDSEHTDSEHTDSEHTDSETHTTEGDGRMNLEVASHTIVIYSDLLDPFAHVAVHRLWTTRADSVWRIVSPSTITRFPSSS